MQEERIKRVELCFANYNEKMRANISQLKNKEFFTVTFNKQQLLFRTIQKINLSTFLFFVIYS